MTHTERVALALALPIGLAIAKLDTRSDEVQGTALLLLLAGAALGAMAPRMAPAVGFLLGIGVPLTYLYMTHAHLPFTGPPPNGIGGTFLALVPPTIGAIGGMGVRRIVSRV
jgi:hypothetical protein